MPLINHSPEFLAKKAKRDQEKERIQAHEAKVKKEQQIVDLYDQLQKLKALDLSKLTEADQKEYIDLVYNLVQHDIPILEFPSLRESELLNEIFRFAKLSGEFTKDGESWTAMESLIKKNRKNIFHLQQLNDLGLGNYYRKYILKEKEKQR